jgi:hypothetical protein
MFDIVLKNLNSNIYNTDGDVSMSGITKKTFGSVKATIGNEGANYFIKYILFPKIEA